MDLTPRDQILMLGNSLEIGVTERREICPYCNGGDSKEKSLAVTRVDQLTIKYLCHRSSCGKRGSMLTNGAGVEETKKEYKFTPTYYTGIAGHLEVTDLEYLETKYGLDLNNVIAAGWMKAEGPGFGLLMPVFGPTGEARGCVLRREFESKKKDVRSFKYLDATWLSWYRTAFSQTVLVEDQISALKAAKYATAVALLGAELTPEKMDEIIANTKGKIWLALDRDAHKKTFDYLKRYRGYCGGNFQAHLLSKDIKNMSYKDIGNLLKVA